jgi:hypothetical protein
MKGLPDGGISDETSLYQVDQGLIRAIWHLGRVVAGPLRCAFSASRGPSTAGCYFRCSP